MRSRLYLLSDISDPFFAQACYRFLEFVSSGKGWRYGCRDNDFYLSPGPYSYGSSKG